VVWDDDESNPIGVGTDLTATARPDNVLIGVLGAPAQANTALPTPADFKLNAFLVPQAGSPGLAGGLSLTFLNPFFTNTTQRGGVITTDQWTTVGTWISTAIN
jgi:hypothetical protein